MDYFLSFYKVILEALFETGPNNVDVILNLIYEKLSDILSSLMVIPTALSSEA